MAVCPLHHLDHDRHGYPPVEGTDRLACLRSTPNPVLAQRGRQIGWWDGEHFTAASPGRAYQLRATQFAQARAALAGVVIVGYWPEPVGA